MKTICRIFLLTFLTLFASCQDEELDTPLPMNPQFEARATTGSSPLIQNADKTWTANKRVPLVGQGRIIDDISNSLIAVLNANGGISNMTDMDLTNYASFGGAALADLLSNQLASVRDINHVYAGGQVAGFVYKISNTSLLTANVLKGFWLKTFLNGQEQETVGGDTGATTLALNMLSAGNNDGQQAISISTGLTKPFDEIKIGMTGISLAVLNSLNLYYAFVGENPIKPVVTGGTYFPNAAIHYNAGLVTGWTSLLLSAQAAKLVNADLTDGATFGTLAGLLSNPYITVNLGTTVSAGSEIGFFTSNVDLLSINLAGGIQLTTFDNNNIQQEEITINSLLGISALAAGKGSQISMIIKKPCSQIRIKYNGVNVSLGSTTVNYAFVRDPIAVDLSSYFSIGNATTSNNYYQLTPPTIGTVTWTITNAPAGAMPTVAGNKISGMTVNGDYTLTATYTKDGVASTQSAIITRNATGMNGTNCSTLIGTAYNASAYQPTGGGSIATIYDKAKNIGNLTDDNPDNYATYHNITSLLANTSIVGIRTGTYINSTGAAIRTGFTMQTSNGLLGVSALKAFQIRLYDNNTLVFQSTTTGNNAVSAELAGNSGNKVRFSVNTTTKFNKIELWTAGVLNLNLGKFRLYNAFWEPIASACPSQAATEACIELLTPTNYGANIHYAETKINAVASAGGSFNNLGNMIDGSLSSYATVIYTNVIGATTVAVKFNTLDANRPIGFIISNPTYLANLDLLNATMLNVYNNGTLVGGTSGGTLLNLDVTGSSGNIYIQATPTAAYNEVRITFPAVASALNTTQIYGIYTRQDSDGNGIPDCAEDNDNPTTSITNAVAASEHVCANAGTGTYDVVINVTGGTVGKTYTLNCYNYGNNNALTTKTVTLSASQTMTATQMPPGDYYISILDGAQVIWNGIHAAVHPLQTTWKTNAATTGWNTWNNWDNGVPWSCTNVIIPGNCVRYPSLKSTEANNCNYIHFAPGGEVVHTQYLTYVQAWVELSLFPGRYYMLSAPLKNMVSGDMFIPASMNGNQGTAPYFTQLNAANSLENRFGPRVYQRLWNVNAPGKKFVNSVLTHVNVAPDATNWTTPFNSLSYAYKAGEGFSMLADKENLNVSTLTFRFPKTHSQFTYFNASGSGSVYNETGIARTNSGRFIYENSDGSIPSSFNVTLTNLNSSNTFLAGNMFMAHIDVAKFLAQNTHVTAVKVYDGNAQNPMIDPNGTLLTSANGYAYIAPMQAFFVTLSSATTQVTLIYTDDMLTQQPETTVRSAAARAVTGADVIDMKQYSKGMSTGSY